METKVVKVGNWVYRNRYNCRHAYIDGETWYCLDDVRACLRLTHLLPDALQDDQVMTATMDDWGIRYVTTKFVNWQGIETLLNFVPEEYGNPYREFLFRVGRIAQADEEFWANN